MYVLRTALRPDNVTRAAPSCKVDEVRSDAKGEYCIPKGVHSHGERINVRNAIAEPSRLANP